MGSMSEMDKENNEESKLPWVPEVSEEEDECGRSGPNEPSVRESDFAFAMFYAKFAPASNLRIRNTSEYAISSMC